jgi:acetyl-CoA acetyltransferase
MYDYGTTEEQLAAVVSKNHRHSVHNDRAMYRRPIEAAEVLASPMVVDPLRLLMLCAPNEGAAAAVLESRPERNGDVKILGAGLRTATRWQSVGEHMPTSVPISKSHVASVTELAAQDAYTDAGVGPEEIDVAEVQAASGASSLGGRLPVNPSGGLLSKSEPVGASGLGQVYEIVDQLRGRCGPRQVLSARVGRTHARVGRGRQLVRARPWWLECSAVTCGSA